MELKRCLFVDDSNVVRKVARRILSGSDMLVMEASTGSEAIDACATEMPDIIVVDGALPDMPTDMVIRRIRALETPVRPRIAVCLVELDISAIMRAKRAGAVGFLMKPFNRSQLLDRFRQLATAA